MAIENYEEVDVYSLDPAQGFAKMLDSPRRLILEVTPEKWITFDAAKMLAASLG